MKVLVTGHYGYKGSVAVPILARAGHEVTGLDTYFYEGCDFVDASTVSMDERDVTEDALQGCDAIVHVAALSNDPLGELDADLTGEINFRATAEIARKANETGVRASYSRRPPARTGRPGRTS